MILWMEGCDDLNGAEKVLWNIDSAIQGEWANQWGRANGAMSIGQNLFNGVLYLNLFAAGDGITEGGFAFWTRHAWSGTDSGRGYHFADSAGVKNFTMQFSSLPTVNFRNAAAAVVATGPFAYYEWEHWEIQFKIDAATGYLIVKRNTVEVVNETGLDTLGVGDAEFCRLIMDTPNAGPTYGNRMIDDLVAYDFAAPNQGWIGYHRIRPVAVNGAGASADFGLFPDGGEVNYENVDETVPDLDTTYNVSGISADLDDVALEDYADEPNIIAIAASVTAVQESVDTTQLKVGIITEGAATDEATFDVGSVDYKRKTHVIHNNPDDSLPWDVADLDGLKLKYEIA